jgi:hypothetical protein
MKEKINLNNKSKFRLIDDARLFLKHNKDAVSLSTLFKGRYLRLTLLGFFLILITSACSLGNIYSLPLIAEGKKKGEAPWFEVILQQTVAIGGIIVGAIIASQPSIGRKYSIFIGLIITSIICVINLIIGKGFNVMSLIMNFSILISYVVAKIYVVEVFPTKLRVMAAAVCFVGGRLGDVITFPLIDLSFSFMTYGPVVFLLIISFIGAFLALLIPIETANLPMDFD